MYMHARARHVRARPRRLAKLGGLRQGEPLWVATTLSARGFTGTFFPFVSFERYGDPYIDISVRTSDRNN
jgi:hypothetical protein